jgi:hypothetical protein
MPNGETGSNSGHDFAARLARASVCACLIRWMGPIPGPYISSPGFPVVTSNWTGWIETESDAGDEFWNALVFLKFYDPQNLQVFFLIPQIVTLAHNGYTNTRTRALGWVGFGASWWPWAWPAWPAWPAPVPGAVYPNIRALASVGLVDCTTVGIPCP